MEPICPHVFLFPSPPPLAFLCHFLEKQCAHYAATKAPRACPCPLSLIHGVCCLWYISRLVAECLAAPVDSRAAAQGTTPPRHLYLYHSLSLSSRACICRIHVRMNECVCALILLCILLSGCWPRGGSAFKCRCACMPYQH